MYSTLIDDLRQTLMQLQNDTASISPAIYDTSIVLRFAPPDDPEPALRWLLSQQAADGGWDDCETSFRARTVPTLAAVLALHHWHHYYRVSSALTAGLLWLRQTAEAWNTTLPDDIPVGLELLMPSLLSDLQQLNLDIPHTAYKSVFDLGQVRIKQIEAVPPERLSNNTAIHSWEAWGDYPYDTLCSPELGVGCSPAATAVWLQRKVLFAHQRTQGGYQKMLGSNRAVRSTTAAQSSLSYLQRAASATGLDIEGVVPTAFPITRFIQAYGLHTLAQAKLLMLPVIADIVQDLLSDLEQAITPLGMGSADDFIPDADDTAAALGALWSTGRKVSLEPLLNFAHSSHFATYKNELQPSLISTARAVQVLNSAQIDTIQHRDWIKNRQSSDGAWLSDKWNSLWIYSTWQAILALSNDSSADKSLDLARDMLLQTQALDGGWGLSGSTAEATACAILALTALPMRSETVNTAVQKGRQYLLRLYYSHTLGNQRHWLAKEQFIPYRLRHIIILSALLSAESIL